MTLSTLDSIIFDVGNGVVDAYTFPYQVELNTHLVVKILDLTTKVATTQVRGGANPFDYTAVVAGDKLSATVTFNTIPSSNEAIIIERIVPITQTQGYLAAGGFPAVLTERALSLQAMISQQLDLKLSRMFGFNSDVTDIGTVQLSANATDRALKALLFDSAGDLALGTPTLQTISGVNPASADGVRDKMVANNDIKLVNDYRLVGHLPLAGGTLTGPVNMDKGADVASAASPDIWLTAEGNYQFMTGVTTVTGFEPAPQAGAHRVIQANGIFQLTHGANLVLPGARDIQTAVGDRFIVYAETTTKFVVDYYRADGSPVRNGRILQSGSVSVGTGTSKVIIDTTTLDQDGLANFIDPNEITINIQELSVDVAAVPIIQLGDSGGIEVTGYSGLGGSMAAAAAGVFNTVGFNLINTLAAANFLTVSIVLTRLGGTLWSVHGTGHLEGPLGTFISLVSFNGLKGLTGGVLDQILLTTVAGTSVFDNGSYNVNWT